MHAVSAKVTERLRFDGQGLVEYGLILVLVALVCIAGLTVLGSTTNTFFNGFSIPSA